MKAKQLYTAAIIVLLLCLACIFASAETRTAAPYVYEILDEENKTAQEMSEGMKVKCKA